MQTTKDFDETIENLKIPYDDKQRLLRILSASYTEEEEEYNRDTSEEIFGYFGSLLLNNHFEIISISPCYFLR